MSETLWGTIDGRDITFPMDVDDFNAVTAMFTVEVPRAQRLLPGDAFEPVETAPGRTQFILAACDYRKNPWGDYNEFNLGFLARPRGAGPEVMGSFVYRMPVDQTFTCEAGNRVMGFPKTVESIPVTYTDTHVTFALDIGGRRAIELTVPRAAPVGEAQRVASVSYSYLDGAPYGTLLEMAMGTGMVDPSEVGLVLGEGEVADELRSLELGAPDYCAWGEGLSATFHLGEAVTVP